MKSFELRAYFEKILQKLNIIDAKVSAMPQVQVQVSSKFLGTLSALQKLDRPATAGEVAEITGHARAFESKILNELWGRGVLLKQLLGRKQIFTLKNLGGRRRER